MKLAVVAYPDLDEEDRQWIEAYRRAHDPQATRIAAHFTLVFPLDAAVNDVEPEVQDVARATQPIRFAIRDAKAVPDKLSNATHVFLVPDEGGLQIAKLHGDLYAGRLRVHLRSDIPFIPHMTVGAAQDLASAERLASEVWRRRRVVYGTISNLHVIDVVNKHVRTVGTYLLGNTAGAVG